MGPESTVWIMDGDDHLRELLARLIKSVGHQVSLYAKPAQLLRQRHDLGPPGCFLFDLQLPEVNGLKLWQELRRLGCPHPCIFISGHADVSMAVESMHEGAVDFLEKPFDHEYLLKRVDFAIQQDFKERQRRLEEAEVQIRVDSLTPREYEVMEWVARGLLTKQIAKQLGISEKTVEVHRSHIKKKMGVQSVAQLVRLLTKHTIVPRPIFRCPASFGAIDSSFA